MPANVKKSARPPSAESLTRGAGARIAIGCRIKPKVIYEIDRLARRRGDTPSTYISNVLEAHVGGVVVCRECGFNHAAPRCNHAR